VGHIQLLQLLHPSDLIRNGPLQLVVAHIQHRQILQQPDLLGQARFQPVIHQYNLIQRVGHVTETGRHAPVKTVIRKHNHRNGRVPDIIGQTRREPVVVDEDRVQILVEERSRDLSLELVESDVEKLERRQLQDDGGELSGESVVAQIELEQQLQTGELVRHDSAEPIRVDVEQCEIGEEAELLRQVSGDVAVVEVDAGDDVDLRLVQGQAAEDAGIVADVGSDPVSGQVERI